MTLAKDGSNRGGFRVGAGRKKKPLAEKILDGKVVSSEVAAVMPVTEKFIIPEPRDFLNAEQKNMNGIKNTARQIYNDTMKWLAERGYADAVPQGLVERYAVAAARWEQCDEVISMLGIAAKHPTTGAQIASPYVSMSLQWMKQTNMQWHLIEEKVREVCGDNLSGTNSQDPMEMLLSGNYKPKEDGFNERL